MGDFCWDYISFFFPVDTRSVDYSSYGLFLRLCKIIEPFWLPRGNGKENGNYRGYKGLYWGNIGIMEKENGNYYNM